MSERIFRVILGATLMLLLYLGSEIGMYVFIAILAFEGITNWRVPVLVSRLRYGSRYEATNRADAREVRIPFDAERALRLVVALMLIGTFVMFREPTWFFPWFVGSMLLLAGFTNICPMVMALRWVGFR